MNYLRVIVALFLIIVVHCAKQEAEVENNDFAEFEEFEEDEGYQDPNTQTEMTHDTSVEKQPETDDDDFAVIEDEDDFEHLQDEDEFEGFDPESGSSGNKGKGQQQAKPDLKISNVAPLSTGWEQYYIEMLMLCGIAAYIANFFSGKSKNCRIANGWFSAHQELLRQNFAVVGDDGTTTEVRQDILIKESEHLYNLWCSGRVLCEGMLVSIKLIKRHDLVSCISRLFKPVTDQVVIKVLLEELDSFVFCVGNRKTINRMHKDVQDLGWYCTEKKSIEKQGGDPVYLMLNEIPEAAAFILDKKIISCLNTFEGIIDYIHISDQFVISKNQEENAAKVPEMKKVLICGLNIPGKGRLKNMEELKPLMTMIFYLIDKVGRFKLGKEARQKADRNRQKLASQFQKLTHTQRSEAAQTRREERKRAEKEKIMAEDDPEKQRKLEEKNQRRESKKKLQRMKTIKVKAS